MTNSDGLYARVVADSVSQLGHRITTMELRFPRFLLPEFNTHRAFSRNSASSRARSVKKTIQEVRDDPFVPWHWPSERTGMAGGASIDDGLIDWVDKLWLDARDEAVRQAEKLTYIGVHKSIVNRLLEPFMWHTVVVTATDWANFFEQRLAHLEDGRPAAEPHFYDLALAMRVARDRSQPEELDPSEWHLPYVRQRDDYDYEEIANSPEYGFDWLRVAMRISVARCAGVSYLNQNTQRKPQQDLDLYVRLRSANPPHWSPFEHVARPLVVPTEMNVGNGYRYNLHGWESLRYLMEEWGDDA